MGAPVTLPVEIGGQTYRMVFKFGTIRIFEEATSQTIQQAFPIFSDKMSQEERKLAAESIPWGTWAALFWAALQPSHRMTREAADDLVDECGPEKMIEWGLRGLVAHLTGNPDLATMPTPADEDPEPGEVKAGKKAKSPAS